MKKVYKNLKKANKITLDFLIFSVVTSLGINRPGQVLKL